MFDVPVAYTSRYFNSPNPKLRYILQDSSTTTSEMNKTLNVAFMDLKPETYITSVQLTIDMYLSHHWNKPKLTN